MKGREGGGVGFRDPKLLTTLYDTNHPHKGAYLKYT